MFWFPDLIVRSARDSSVCYLSAHDSSARDSSAHVVQIFELMWKAFDTNFKNQNMFFCSMNVLLLVVIL